jgi:DNA repair photolyase
VFGRETLLALLSPLRPGDALAPGVTLVDASAEPSPALRLRDGDRLVDVEVGPRTPGARAAAETPRMRLAYRAAPGLDPRRGQALCRLLAQRIAAREDAVLAELRPRGPEAPVQRVPATRALERRDVPGAPHYGLSPYVGCLIGCKFCYAQSRLSPLRRLLGRAERPWGTWVDVRDELPSRLAEELTTAPPLPVKLTPIVSDPYQAVERRERLTRRCLDALAAAPAFTPLVLTRSDLVLDDLERLAAMPRAHVGVSLPTLDEEVLARFEPRAAGAARRLEVLRRFHAAGVATFAVVQPILPGPIDALADALAGAVDSVHVDVLHGEEGAAAELDDPRHADARTPAWQHARARELVHALRRRDVRVWSSELPPSLCADSDSG